MSVKQALQSAGLLFQPHPQIGSWQTTRPGALSGEVVAFTNEPANFDRLSIRFFEAGETDDTYTYKTDTWVVETMDREHEYEWTEQPYQTRQEAIERVEEIMRDVTEQRE